MSFKTKSNTEIVCVGKKKSSKDESVQKLCVPEPHKNGLRLENGFRKNY